MEVDGFYVGFAVFIFFLVGIFVGLHLSEALEYERVQTALLDEVCINITNNEGSYYYDFGVRPATIDSGFTCKIGGVKPIIRIEK